MSITQNLDDYSRASTKLPAVIMADKDRVKFMEAKTVGEEQHQLERVKGRAQKRTAAADAEARKQPKTGRVDNWFGAHNQ